MKLGPVVLKLRLADTRFENRIAGAAELEIAQKNTLKTEMAFVIQLSEVATENNLDNGINQTITEKFAVVVAIANDTTQKDKTGLTAYDVLYNIRQEIFSAILGWAMPNSEYLVEYAGGRLLDINRGYLWYQFDFKIDTRITEQDGIDTGYGDLPLFDEIYAQYILAPDADNLPLSGVGNLLPAASGVDMAQIISFVDEEPETETETLGIDWIEQLTPNAEINSITFNDGLFVAVTDTGAGNRVITTSDGITWTRRASAADNFWNSVCYGNGLFVAVASSGTGNRVMTSSDGITWTSRASAADNFWRSVCYGNGLFVAVASSGTGNRVMTSSDGITWTSRASAADDCWKSVCYGDGLFVAVSETAIGNKLMFSPDGINWTLKSTGTNRGFYGVCHGNGLFVAVAGNGAGNRIITSPNGAEWTLRRNPIDNWWNAICYGNGLFVAVANSGTGNRVMTSSDGVEWTIRTSPNDNGYQSIAYGNNRFIAVADSGTLYRAMISS